MEQSILTSFQEKVLAEISKEKRLKDFYLSGGTALAGFYFHHRLSDDLDFFTYDDPDVVFLHEFAERLKTRLNSPAVRFERLYDRYQFYFVLGEKEELKIEFGRYHFASLENPLVQDGLRIDSLRDVSANKLMALLDRFDPKDFVDLYFILKQTSLEKVRTDTAQKFGLSIDPLFLGGELAKVRRIEALPKMIKPLRIEELKTFFSEQAKKLSPNILF